MKHWWKTCHRKILKKWRINHFYQDGISYSFEDWECIMKMLNNLRPGDPIFNPWAGSWTTMKKIKLVWTPVVHYSYRFGMPEWLVDHIKYDFDSDETKIIRGPKRHKFVSEFKIIANDGCAIYEFSHFGNKYIGLDKAGWFKNVKDFNRAAGLDDDCCMIPESVKEITGRRI